MSTRHAVVEIVFDAFEATPVPPQYVTSFIYTDRRRGGGTSVQVEFFDPTFVTVEPRILGLVSESVRSHMMYRWGFPTSNVWTHWREGIVKDYESELTNGGQRIKLQAMTPIPSRSLLLPGKSYRGKISKVAKAIALDLGYREDLIFIDETDDEEGVGSAATGDTTGGLSFATESPLEYIAQDLVFRARVGGIGDVHFWLASGREGPEFHFRRLQERAVSRSFRYLLGHQDEVINFKPTLKTKELGGIALGGAEGFIFDTTTKKFRRVPMSPRQFEAEGHLQRLERAALPEALQASLDSLSDDLSGEDTQVRMHSIHSDEATAEAEIRTLWEGLYHRAGEASMTLHGTETYCLLEAEEIIEMQVVLPTGDLHWSGGLYRTIEVVHDVGSAYTIQCELLREHALISGAGSGSPSSRIGARVS